jgi:hypothetical protein
MSKEKSKIHALEFDCQSPLKFFEHCSSCPKFDNGQCPDLQLGIQLLRRKITVSYNSDTPEGAIHASQFNCAAPLKYFEKTRKQCPHMGRCREEGLLLALLSGKKELTYGQKEVLPLVSRKPSMKRSKVNEQQVQAAS